MVQRTECLSVTQRLKHSCTELKQHRLIDRDCTCRHFLTCIQDQHATTAANSLFVSLPRSLCTTETEKVVCLQKYPQATSATNPNCNISFCVIARNATLKKQDKKERNKCKITVAACLSPLFSARETIGIGQQRQAPTCRKQQRCPPLFSRGFAANLAASPAPRCCYG